MTTYSDLPRFEHVSSDSGKPMIPLLIEGNYGIAVLRSRQPPELGRRWRSLHLSLDFIRGFCRGVSLYDLLQFDKKVTSSGQALLKIGNQLKAKSLTIKVSEPHVNDICLDIEPRTPLLSLSQRTGRNVGQLTISSTFYVRDWFMSGLPHSDASP